ncbi:MAG: LuxR family transcriptional regulator [Bacteroidales bacterium]|nr:LuxR family transcriptional regulator [Bacteroidales bacterium]
MLLRAKAENNKYGISLAYAESAFNHAEKGDLNNAYNALEKGYLAYDGLDLPKLYAFLNVSEGFVNYKAGDFFESCQSVLKGYKIYESLHDFHWMAKCNSLISLQYYQLEDYDNAIEYLRKVIDYEEKGKNNKSLASDYQNMGMYMMYSGAYDSAIIYLNRSLALLEKKPSLMVLSAVYEIKGEMFSKQHLFDSATIYLSKSRDIAIQQKNGPRYISTTYSLGSIAQKKSDLKVAEQLYIQGNDSAQKYELRDQIFEGYLELFNIAYKAGKYKQAYEYYNQYQKFRDEESRKKNKSIAALLEIQNRYEHYYQKLLAKQQLQQYQLKVKNSFILILFLLLIVLALLIVFFYKWAKLRQQYMIREKNSLNTEIGIKKKELSVILKEQMKDNESINCFLKEMDDKVEGLGENNRKVFSKMVSQFKNQHDKKIWEEFEIRFKNENEVFYNILSKTYDTLTPAELKICLLLRIDMPTKDIATVLFKSEASIEVDRSRIRKKLGINNRNINLTEFLITLG